MPKTIPANPKDILELATALSALGSPKAVKNFLHDVATPQEIDALAQRFKIARLLWDTDLSYQEIAQQTKASTTTITRVARFLKQERFGGYREALNLLHPKK
ncbi:MAG: YerC/YecD family TrpR-related protein [bacterium]|nr:YerC/YecD family TrpR-related protein [bacterium]